VVYNTSGATWSITLAELRGQAFCKKLKNEFKKIFILTPIDFLQKVHMKLILHHPQIALTLVKYLNNFDIINLMEVNQAFTDCFQPILDDRRKKLQKIIDWYSKSRHRFDTYNIRAFDNRAIMSADTLSSAVNIDLSYGDLDSMPPEIRQLTNLEGLHIDNNQLTGLPAEIGQLINLKHLFLYNNKLTSLPPEIGHLTNLVEINLGNNRLTNLPAEIGQLAELKYLFLYDNQLTSLPAEIGQLTNLEAIHLGINRLTNLPAEIGQLAELKTLVLDHNKLNSLPPEIGQLTNLVSLHVGNNQLTSLPSEIGQLTNLGSFTIRRNPLVAHLAIEHLTAQILLKFLTSNNSA